MILKFLGEDNQEEKYERLSTGRQFELWTLTEQIEKETGSFVVMIDINEDAGIVQVVKMHYDEDGCLIFNSINKF